MNNKSISLFILTALLFTAGVFAFADQPDSSLDDKPSVDSAANSEVQAPTPPPGVSAADTQSTYLYDLKKLIDKSRENIKEVNEKIMEQAALKRNQKREERAREYYEKGLELTNEGKLDEAREYFEKAIRITEHPEMAGYIKESQRRLKKQEAALQAQENEHYHQIKQDESTRKEDVEEAYKEAVDLYKQKKYHPAKDAFEHVNEIAPDYRATDSYLKIIDQDINIADALAAKKQEAEIANQQKEAEAARAKEKAMWLAQIEEKEKERKEAIDAQAKDVYDQAVELYKHKKFAEAKKKFEEVSWVIPDYKATMKYLARIDRDAKEEEERAAKEQQKALQEQRWEAMVEQKKQEALHQQELQAKELQHKKDLQEQAQFLYTAAVALFDKKNLDEALEKFNDIEKLLPDYRSTRMYIARIERSQPISKPTNPAVVVPSVPAQTPVAVSPAVITAPATVVKAPIVVAVTPTAVVQAPVEETASQKEQDYERQRALELKETTDQAQKIYSLALDSYRAHRWEEARAQFENVEQLIPDYKHTHHYLNKIDDYIARDARLHMPSPAAAPVPPTPVAVSAPVVPSAPAPAVNIATPAPAPPSQGIILPATHVNGAVSMEDQQKQMEDIAALADRSAQLYRRIADMANDRSTEQVERKMAQVDEILRNLKADKERYMRRLHEKQFQQLERERRDEAEKIYREGVRYYHAHDYTDAKIKFSALENISPDYRATHSYLSHIEIYQRNANVAQVTLYKSNGEPKVKILQNKVNAQVVRNVQVVQQKEQNIVQQQQLALQNIAQKATQINDDIIRLSRQQDYEGMKAKFTELENTVNALTTLKSAMSSEKQQQDHERQLASEPVGQRIEMIKKNELASQPTFSKQASDADKFKQHEIKQEQDILFKQGVDLYENKKYSQAKLLFGELTDQNDRRAEAWLRKTDHAIAQEILKSQAGEERERTEFIAEQVRAQRELIVIQERERQRQKKLTEELERQKRLYEDDRLYQIRKEETMKVQERERQRQEAKRLRLEEENEKQQEMYRFHKIVPETKKLNAEPAPSVPGTTVKQDVVNQVPLSQSQLEAQREDVRKQLENGVEIMYQAAMNLYNKGEYGAAEDRFKDVQDIIPGYKSTEQLMNEARLKSMSNNPRSEIITDSSQNASVPVSRQDSVSKALDLFDNAK